jgi:hypothetical protein
MKLTTILLSVLIASPVYAQVVPPGPDNVSHDEWKREQTQSIALALKLYPELSEKGDKLKTFIDKIWPDSNLFPKIANDSFAPLFYATVAAQELGISAQFQSLTDTEKAAVFQEITSHASHR